LTGLSGEERKVRILFPAFLRPSVQAMRLASFFLLSVSLHALALACPLSFAKPKQPDLIQISILPAEYESTDARSGAQSSGSSHSLPAAKSSVRRSAARANTVFPIRNNDAAPQKPPMPIAPEGLEIQSSAPIFVPPRPAENQSKASRENFYAADGMGRAADGDAAGENGDGVGGNGSAVLGSGAGDGKNGGQHGANLTQPRYRETPKPNYPESARRKGREGTVLLRVLVNEEGRAKAIEINKSSGDDALDRAAREAIQGWRFIPARYGEKVVESWIRIPVDFRLADTHAR
jgi:periplasmic protein TonB